MQTRGPSPVTPSTASVPSPSAPPDAPLRTRDDLLRLFHDACKPRDRWRIGAEGEKFGVDRKTGAPLLYAGDRGVAAILHDLVARAGWREESEYPGSPTIALRQGNASVTLEPGSQLELSGAPLADVHAIVAELDAHLADLAPITERFGIAWLGVGFHPLAKQSQLDWVPKSRYGIMREYLLTRGQMGVDMMRRTATVQANYDFASEADAIRKLRVSLKLGPVTTALFANSPFVEGGITGEKSRRARVWLDVDPDRTGLVPGVWREGAGFQEYVDWALGVPMFLLKRDGHAIDNRGQTFADYLANGFQGHRATFGDWETHLNTLFPEVRLKRTLEIRGADSQPRKTYGALPALWTGILYDDRALAEAEALVADVTVDQVVASRARLPWDGLDAKIGARSLRQIGERLLDIADGGLARRAILDAQGRDERIHLAALKALCAAGKSPADELVAGLPSTGDLTAALIERCAM
jgi:glutamate--cysteine ligase